LGSVEQLFHWDSRRVTALLRRHGNSTGERWEEAVRSAYSWSQLFGLDDEKTRDLLDLYWRENAIRAGLPCDFRSSSQGQVLYQELSLWERQNRIDMPGQATAGADMLGMEPGFLGPAAILSEHGATDSLTVPFINVIASLMHMTINRVLSHDQNRQELMIAHLLRCAYRRAQFMRRDIQEGVQ
jgi:thiopeptide-type bacteriocin biosynthesis protein